MDTALSHHTQKSASYFRSLFFGLFTIAGVFVFTASVHAATITMTPSDSFSSKIRQLNPGDTLLVGDGTYTGNYVKVDCAASAKNGTASAPITIKAQNERKAFLKGNGSARPIEIINCGYWVIEGLRAENGDFRNEAGGTESGSVIVVAKSHHITLRRLLGRFNNRWINSSILQLVNVSDSLIEENELYSYHRHGFTLGGGDRNVFRRNYANSRGYADLSGGYASANGWYKVGDSGFIQYPRSGNDNLYENNISEGNGGGFWINSKYGSYINTRLLGNISLTDIEGVRAQSGDTSHRTTKNLMVENQAALNSFGNAYQLYANSASCKNCTAIGARQRGFEHGVYSHLPGDGRYSYTEENLLSVGNGRTGVVFSSQIQTWSVNGVNSFGNSSSNYAPASGNYTNKQSIDPKLGSCKVWIPAGSPMKGAGTGGKDIGANILYAYENGKLTNKPLWNPQTGEFPHGAVIPGVNDIPGDSAFDVHKRLNVNQDGCSFPQGYGGVWPPGPGNAGGGGGGGGQWRGEGRKA